jgi:hypothetical protein
MAADCGSVRHCSCCHAHLEDSLESSRPSSFLEINLSQPRSSRSGNMGVSICKSLFMGALLVACVAGCFFAISHTAALSSAGSAAYKQVLFGGLALASGCGAIASQVALYKEKIYEDKGSFKKNLADCGMGLLYTVGSVFYMGAVAVDAARDVAIFEIAGNLLD